VATVGGPDHVVTFYADDKELADQVYEHLCGSAEQGTAIVIATPEHRKLISERLAQAGIDVPGEWARGSYVALDAAKVMASFMVAGWPDAAAFWGTVSPVVKSALARQGPVRVFGEMVALQWAAGHTSAAVDLEALWNELASQYSFSLLCAYPASAVSGDDLADDVAHLHAAHSAVAPARPA
jgi:MEDS: MEthanogen/methylotroph, DcmR Sensory domain